MNFSPSSPQAVASPRLPASLFQAEHPPAMAGNTLVLLSSATAASTITPDAMLLSAALPAGALTSTVPCVPKASDEEQAVPEWQDTPIATSTAPPARLWRVERLPSIEQLAKKQPLQDSNNLMLPPLRLSPPDSKLRVRSFSLCARRLQ